MKRLLAAGVAVAALIATGAHAQSALDGAYIAGDVGYSWNDGFKTLSSAQSSAGTPYNWVFGREETPAGYLRLGKRVAPNSVYRILDLFVRTNLARRVESINAYIANSHPGCLHDCIFLVCDSCGSATHIDDDGLSRSVRKTAEAAGYVDIRPVIEVRGRCADCD